MTDHIAKAEQLSDLKPILRDGISPASAQVAMACAQVHATLALVDATEAQTEQLRLANVIAWTTQAGRMPSPETRDVVAKGMGI